MAFADGTTGVLVWGGGDELRLTVGRADLWDHRGGYAWTDAQNYTNIVSLWRAGEKDRLLGLFRNDPPANWGGRYNPYMLPLGRVVMKLAGGATLVRGELDPFTGLGKLILSDGQAIKLAMSRKSRAFALRLPEGVACESRSVPATDFGVYERILKQRGFEKAVVFDGKIPDCGGFRWKLPADEPVWLTWGCKGRECAVRTGRGDRTVTEGAGRFAEIAAESVAQWTKFWAEGARVHVPDPVLQRIYDYGMYRFGAMTDPDGVPAGLQGPWLEDDRLVPWNGDYHFNINVQECYSPAFRGGHSAHLMPLFRMILAWRPRLRENARKFCGIDDGYVMPHAVDDRGTCIGGFWTGTIDHASAAWMASYMFRYVRYSGDTEFLKDAAYDFMKGAMNVYLAILEDREGNLAIPLGPSPEWMGADFKRAVGRNPSFQLAACHRLARDLIAASGMLGEAADPRWLDVEKRLPAFSRVTESSGDAAVWGNSVADGIAIFEGVNLHESHRHHSHMAGIYPFDTIARTEGRNRKMLDETYGNWVLRGTGMWTGWCVPWASILHADAGNATAAVQLLHAWDAYFCDEGHGSHHDSVTDGFTNFRHGRNVMQMDGQCAAVTAVLELMAHERDGQTEFFRGCPSEWKEVSFENLALSDGRRVSGRRTDGSVSLQYELPLQLKIDAAAAAGGGRVVVPAGRHLTGQLDLKSNVELHLEKGAVLEGKVGLDNYRVTELPYSEGTWSAVVSAIGVTNVSVTGEGEIFGNGTAWSQPENYGGNQEGLRPRGLFFADCRGVRLNGFSLCDSACWGVVLKCCEDVEVRGLRIDSHANANNDGIDVEARNVVIADCDVDTGDDGVCLKSNDPNFVVENVIVSNVVSRSHCNALKIGTATHGTIRNVLFVDCRTEAPRRDFVDRRKGRCRKWYENEDSRMARLGYDWTKGGAAISALCVENVDGGTVEDVTCRDIRAEGACVPIFVRAGTRTGRSCGTPPSSQRVFRRIRFENISGHARSFVASSVTGVEGCRIADVSLKNVSIVCNGAGARSQEAMRDPVPELPGHYPDAHMFGHILPAYGLYVRHVDGLMLDDVRFALEEGSRDDRQQTVFEDATDDAGYGRFARKPN